MDEPPWGANPEVVAVQDVKQQSGREALSPSPKNPRLFTEEIIGGRDADVDVFLDEGNEKKDGIFLPICGTTSSIKTAGPKLWDGSPTMATPVCSKGVPSFSSTVTRQLLSTLLVAASRCARAALRNAIEINVLTGIMLMFFMNTKVEVRFPAGAADLVPIVNSVQLLQAERLDLTTRRKDFVALGRGRAQLAESISIFMEDGKYWNLLYPTSRGLMVGNGRNAFGDRTDWQLMNTICVTADDNDGDGIAVVNTRTVTVADGTTTLNKADVSETCDVVPAVFSDLERFGEDTPPPELLSCFYLSSIATVSNLAGVETDDEVIAELRMELEAMANTRNTSKPLRTLVCKETTAQLGVTRYFGLPGKETEHIDVFWEVGPSEGGELLMRRQVTKNARWDISDLEVRFWQETPESGDLELIPEEDITTKACDVIATTIVTVGGGPDSEAAAFTLVNGRPLTQCDSAKIGPGNLDISERALSSLLTELDRKVGQDRPREDSLAVFASLVLAILATTIIEVRLTIILDRCRIESKTQGRVSEALLLAIKGKVPFEEYRKVCFHNKQRLKHWRLYRSAVMLGSILVLTAPILFSLVGSLRADAYTDEVIVVDTAAVEVLDEKSLNATFEEIFKEEDKTNREAMFSTIGAADIWVGRGRLINTETQFAERLGIAIIVFVLSIIIAVTYIWDKQISRFLLLHAPGRPKRCRMESIIMARVIGSAGQVEQVPRREGHFTQEETTEPPLVLIRHKSKATRSSAGSAAERASLLEMGKQRGQVGLVAVLPAFDYLLHK